MSNEELIAQSRQAMNDLWHLNSGKLLEHEQAAYNCLRRLCDRLDRIEIVRPIIEDMRDDASEHISEYGQAPHSCSWGDEEGVLIQNKQALEIYDACFGR